MKEINISVNLNIDEQTATSCLALAAMYANSHGLKIRGERNDNGDVVYWFEERRR